MICVLIRFYYIDEYYLHENCYNLKKEEYKIDNILCNNCLPILPTSDDKIIIY